MFDRPADETVIWPAFREIDIAQNQLPYSVLVEPALKWIRPLPRLALDLYGARATFLTAPVERLTHAKVLSTYHNAILTWSHCLLTGGIFQCFFASGGEAWARDVGSYPLDHAWRKEAGLLVDQGRVGLDRTKWTPHVRISGRVLLASPDEPSNWGLFLLNAVPAAHYFLANRQLFDKFMCFAPPGSFRELLGEIGITDDVLIVHDVFETYELEQVSMFRHTMRDLFVHPTEHRLLREQAQAAIDRLGHTGNTRVFLSRHERFRRFGPYRTLMNEEALIEGLEGIGFTTLNLEFLPAAEQIRAVASADVVVGLGGAGMFNTVFCTPGTTVIDIESTPLFLDAHANIFASCGHNYSMILGLEDESDPSAGHKRWTIDCTRTLSVIRHLSG